MIRWLFGDIETEIGHLATEVSLLRRAVKGLAIGCRKPQVRVRLFHKGPDMALVYAISAGAPVDTDVVSRELTVTINGTVSLPTTFSGAATDLGTISVDQGANVVLTLIDVDDAGNRSQPATVEFIAADTIPPAQPGSFGVSLVREE
jgi:hypothetical protein